VAFVADKCQYEGEAMNSIVAKVEGAHLTIKISGRFTFSLYKDFAASYKNVTGSPTHIDIDMRAVEYLDSAALGMLLSLRNYFSKDEKISLLNATDSVKKILEIARFDKKFTIN